MQVCKNTMFRKEEEEEEFNNNIVNFQGKSEELLY